MAKDNDNIIDLSERRDAQKGDVRNLKQESEATHERLRRSQHIQAERIRRAIAAYQGKLKPAQAEKLAMLLHQYVSEIPNLQKGKWLRQAGVTSDDVNPAARANRFLIKKTGDETRDRKRRDRLNKTLKAYLTLLDTLVDMYPSHLPDRDELVNDMFQWVVNLDEVEEMPDEFIRLHEHLKRGCDAIIGHYRLKDYARMMTRYGMRESVPGVPEYGVSPRDVWSSPGELDDRSLLPEVTLGTIILHKYEVEVTDEAEDVFPAQLQVAQTVSLALLFTEEAVKPVLRLAPTALLVEVADAADQWRHTSYVWKNAKLGEITHPHIEEHDDGELSPSHERVAGGISISDDEASRTLWLCHVPEFVKRVKDYLKDEDILPLSVESVRTLFEKEHAHRFDASQRQDYTGNARLAVARPGTLAAHVEESLLTGIDEGLHPDLPELSESELNLPGVLGLLDIDAKRAADQIGPGVEQFKLELEEAHEQLRRQLDDLLNGQSQKAAD